MEVKLGSYPKWWGPYQIADAIFWWQDKYSDTCVWADRASRLGDWLATDRKGNPSLLTRACEWVRDKNPRMEHVRVDAWDTWSADHTLALIIVPVLKQLQATKHGAPLVADKDVPDDLKSTSVPAPENAWDVDANHFKRWDWVIGEMIWAFEEHTKTDLDPENIFFDENGHLKDQQAYEAYQHRKHQGFRLFGEYYTALWD